MTDSLEAIYAELPNLQCQGKCQQACGPIAMAKAEKNRFRKAGKEVPQPMQMLASGDLTCPHLSPAGRCSTYALRPLLCRIYGSVKAMRCEWGCTPDEWLSDSQARDLLARAEAL